MSKSLIQSWNFRVRNIGHWYKPTGLINAEFTLIFKLPDSFYNSISIRFDNQKIILLYDVLKFE